MSTKRTRGKKAKIAGSRQDLSGKGSTDSTNASKPLAFPLTTQTPVLSTTGEVSAISSAKQLPGIVLPTAWIDPSGQLNFRTTTSTAATNVRLTLNDLRTGENSRRMFPWVPPTPQQDETFPRDDASRAQYAFQLLNGMIDISRALDKPSSKTHFVEYWQSPASESALHYNIFDMGRVCNDLLTFAEKLHQEGLGSVPCYDDSQFEHQKMGKDMNFKTRIDTLTDLLSLSKHKCEELMKGTGKELTVLRCKVQCHQVIDNNKNNKARAVVYQKGKEKKEEEKLGEKKAAGDEESHAPIVLKQGRTKSTKHCGHTTQKGKSTQESRAQRKTRKAVNPIAGIHKKSSAAIAEVSTSSSVDHTNPDNDESFQAIQTAQPNGDIGSVMTSHDSSRGSFDDINTQQDLRFDEPSVWLGLNDGSLNSSVASRYDWTVVEDPASSTSHFESGSTYDSHVLSAFASPPSGNQFSHCTRGSASQSSAVFPTLVASIQGSDGDFRLAHVDYPQGQTIGMINHTNNHDDPRQSNHPLSDSAPSQTSAPLAQMFPSFGRAQKVSPPSSVLRSTALDDGNIASSPKRKRSVYTDEELDDLRSPPKRQRSEEQPVIPKVEDPFDIFTSADDYVSVQSSTAKSASSSQSTSSSSKILIDDTESTNAFSLTDSPITADANPPAPRPGSPFKRKRPADADAEAEVDDDVGAEDEDSSRPHKRIRSVPFEDHPRSTHRTRSRSSKCYTSN